MVNKCTTYYTIKETELVGKDKSQAEKMLDELRVIPKLIEQLKLDIETTRSSLLTSPQWSDMRVQGGIKKSQEDKNIAIIDTSDYNIQQINELMARRTEIIKQVMQLPDIMQRHILITTYLNCESFEEARYTLGIGKDKYYTIKRKGIESLDRMICR